MSVTMANPGKNLFVQPRTTKLTLRPRFEGSNICSWIGFKHVMYLIEEGVLDHFRNAGFVPRELFERYGLCLEIVDSSTRILHALHMDDAAEIEVTPEGDDGSELRYAVNVSVARNGARLKAAVAKAAVLFKVDDSLVTAGQEPQRLPALTPYTVARISRTGDDRRTTAADLSTECVILNPDDFTARLAPKDTNSFIWKHRVPYFYCHFTERMQHSGYLRLLEEVEDLFLASRGISIRTMLHTKKWIPVVPLAQVQILEEAYMEEPIYTVYTVEDVYKEFTYTHRMDCYVLRDGRLIRTATGRITHGYAIIENRRDWSLVSMDEATLAAIKNQQS